MSVSTSPLPRSNRDRAFVPRLAVAALAAALTGWSGIAAQPADHVRELGDLSIKELMELEVDSVYGASRYVQRTSRAPSSISVITAEDIKRFGARTLDDVLSSVRGLYVPNDRNYSYLGIRGFQRPNDYNTRVLVLIDGHRMNDNVYDLGATGREGMVDIDLVERIEVIRGPSSSIYGSSAFFGVINVVTKRGATFEGFEAAGEAGTFDTFKSRLSYGTTFANGIEWLVSASRYTSAGQDRLYYPEFDERISADPRATNNGIAEQNDGEDANNLFTSLRYGDFSFSAFWNGRVKEVPTASYGTVFNDPREETEDVRSYVDFRYDHRFDNDLSLQARVFYDEYDYSGVYPNDFAEPGFPPDVVLSKDETFGRWIGTELQVTGQVGERHTVIVGGEYRDNMRELQTAFYDLDPLDYYLVDDRSSHTLGIFAQSETELTETLLFTAGVRYDRYSSDAGDTLNPRLGLIYSPSDTDTLKLVYGEAFRAPNPYERYYYDEQPNRPALEPETIHTTEVAYEKQLGERYRLTVAGYYYHVRDLLSQAATDTSDIYFDNLDSARAKGLEIEIDRQFMSGAHLRASYALQKAVDGLTDVDLSNSPRDIAKLSLSLPFAGDRLSAGLEVQYNGSVWTLRGNRVDDFVTANLTLFNHRTTAGLELSGTVYNLFDEQYAYPGAEDHLQDSLLQNGRTFLGKLTYRF
jgi:outer membrane receptor for ferrienterochelin and colicins